MPTLNFILPHWMYWGGLVAFPAVAMYLVAHQRRRGAPREPILFTAYLLWLCSGFAGIHRFYLKSWWGFAFIPFLIAVIYCNAQVRDVREDVSRTFAALEQAQVDLDQAKPRPGETPTEEERKAIESAQSSLKASQTEYQAAKAVSDRWFDFSRGFAGVLALLLLIDAFLMPRLVKRLRAQPDAAAPAIAATPPRVDAPADVPMQGTAEDPTIGLHTRATDAIEWVSVKAGEYVAYWAVISVFVYYYEVIARFLFNSPTNWVHESMFLMYGMQYMISGAYAYREDQHVRVDVLYSKLPARGKAIADIISSVFFFIFTVTMLVTGMRFAMDAVANAETSFTEWSIQYWPVKLAIPIGAALIILQGVSKLIKDVVFVMRKEA